MVHVVRHGIDVALSLQKRELAKEAVPNPFVSIRCRTLSGAFSLWAFYVRTIRRHLAQVPPARQLTLHYEALLANPQRELARLAQFCALPLAEDDIAQAVAGIRADRAYAHRNSDAGRRAAERWHADPLLAELGYAAAGREAAHEQ